MPFDAEAVSLVAFDLDDTLAESKSPITFEMADALTRLMRLRLVAIISGGRMQQFDRQVLQLLPDDAPLVNLHLLPTCGARYMRYVRGSWREVYGHELTTDECARAIASITKRAKELGSWEPDDKVSGDRIENRGSQITYSALGQLAAAADKRVWDPTGVRRHALRDAVQADVPDLAVSAGGSTSIDITRRGVDKAYGLQQLEHQTGVPLDNMLFIGDRTEPGGNDHSVVLLGVTTIAVTNVRQTQRVVISLCDQFEESQ